MTHNERTTALSLVIHENTNPHPPKLPTRTTVSDARRTMIHVPRRTNDNSSAYEMPT
ncbi:hypothetical protein IC582_025478 [Cucumis melo]